MCYSTQGGCFFAIELTTGKIRDEFKSTGSYIMSHILKTAADGKVYSHIYPSGMFDVYDPIARTYMAVNPGYNVHSQDGGTVTDDGRILIGEYASAGASVYEYNIYDKTFKRYGPFDPTWTYIKGIAADGKYIYAGTGIDKPNCKVLRINRETGEYDILACASSQDVRLAATVHITSTQCIPMHIHMNTTIAELLANPKTKAFIEGMTDDLIAHLGGSTDENDAS